LIDRLENSGYKVHRLGPAAAAESDDPRTWLGVNQARDADDSLAALSGEKFDWLVVDHYAIDAQWERRMRAAADRVLVIDDLSNRPHDADLLLDQNYVATGNEQRYDSYVPRSCRKLLGPRFALLQPIYRQIRRVAPQRDASAMRVLVFFGAHDVERTVVKVLRALHSRALEHLRVDVVPGSDPSIVAEVRKLADQERITVHEHLPSLAGVMLRADFAIGAGGATTWERACLGLPTLVATIAENQWDIACALAKEDFIALAGRSRDISVESWTTFITQLVRDPQRLVAMGARSFLLTDGFGASRVAHAMTSSTGREISIRRAIASDEALLFEWANDPDVRGAAFNKERITADGHRGWFSRRLADPNCMILIGEDECGLPLGQVRFDSDLESNEATVDISVDRDVRGSGVGAQLLVAASKYWRALVPKQTAVAEVLIDNERSRRMFAAAGFASTSARRPQAVAFQLRPET
jgi:UDP-2,4-diacetamido-2,4,6-trideoxy-beta-L-altropyranose hydrolase